MEQRRALHRRLEQRLREREADAEQLWASLQLEAGAIAPALGNLIEGVSRGVTWALWEMAMFEAANVIAELELDHAKHQTSVRPWLCPSCKRGIVRVVGRDDEAVIDDLSHSA